jgi:hypothetical protein
MPNPDHAEALTGFPPECIQIVWDSAMFLRFIGPTDLESWARDYRLEVTATDDGPVVTGISGHICQLTDDLLAGDHNRPLGFIQTQTGNDGL